MVFREGHGTSELPTPVLVPAQLEKQHRQKALVHYCRVNKPISVYFLYDLAAVLKQQVPAISFRSSASLINTGILLLIQLFEEDEPCASTFALMDLTPMLLHLQRHRESKWTMTEPSFWTNNTPISLLMQLNIFTRYLKLIRESITQFFSCPRSSVAFVCALSTGLSICALHPSCSHLLFDIWIMCQLRR